MLALGATASVDSAGEESEQPPWRGASPAMSLGELASSLESSQDEEEARLRAAVRDPANCVIARGGKRVVPSTESMQRVSIDDNPRMQTNRSTLQEERRSLDCNMRDHLSAQDNTPTSVAGTQDGTRLLGNRTPSPISGQWSHDRIHAEISKKSKYQCKGLYTRSLTSLLTLLLTRDRLNEVIDAASPSMEWFRGRSRARREGTLSPVPSRTSLHRSSKETRAVAGMARQAQRGKERERELGRDTVTGQAGLQTGKIVALTSNISRPGRSRTERAQSRWRRHRSMRGRRRIHESDSQELSFSESPKSSVSPQREPSELPRQKQCRKKGQTWYPLGEVESSDPESVGEADIPRVVEAGSAKGEASSVRLCKGVGLSPKTEVKVPSASPAQTDVSPKQKSYNKHIAGALERAPQKSHASAPALHPFGGSACGGNRLELGAKTKTIRELLDAPPLVLLGATVPRLHRSAIFVPATTSRTRFGCRPVD